MIGEEDYSNERIFGKLVKDYTDEEAIAAYRDPDVSDEDSFKITQSLRDRLDRLYWGEGEVVINNVKYKRKYD